VKVDGKNLVVSVTQRGAEAKETTIATDDKTKFLVDAEAGKLADLKPEMMIVVISAPADAPAKALVMASTRGLNGTVVKVDGKDVVISAGRRGDAKEVTVATDEKTKVFLPGENFGELTYQPKPGKLADLKADMRVTVLPETGTAVKIIANPPMRGPGGRGPASRPAM
jgi:hypothetical protein